MKNKVLILALGCTFALGACGPDEDEEILREAVELQEQLNARSCAEARQYIAGGGSMTVTQTAAYSMACGGAY